MMYQADWTYPGAPTVEVAELPRGRQHATPIAVPATLSVSSKAKDPVLATAALALLAERATQEIVPPPRRQPASKLQALEPRLSATVAEALVQGLQSGRSLVLNEIRRSQQLHMILHQQLVLPIHSGARSVANSMRATHDAIQNLL